MKKMKYWLLIAVALVVVAGLSAFTMDHQLKASEGDGTTTAAEQQAEKSSAKETETVTISVPAKEEVKEVKEAAPAKEEVKEVKEAAPAKEEVKEVKEEAAPAKEEVKEEAAPAKEEVKEEAAPVVEEVKEEAAPAVEEAVEEAAPTAKKSVRIVCRNKSIEMGDTVRLEAKLSGFGKEKVTLIWQYFDKNAGEHGEWVTAKKGGEVYTFVMTEAMADVDWRLVVED